MSIQWFPGHMNTARKEAAKTMEVIDVIVEVLDVRIPNASSNPLIEELRLARQRPSLKVLNKADLADPVITQAWSTCITSDQVSAPWPFLVVMRAMPPRYPNSASRSPPIATAAQSRCAC